MKLLPRKLLGRARPIKLLTRKTINRQDRTAIMISSIVLAGIGLAAQVSAACTRSSLEDLAKQYVKSQNHGMPTMLPIAANINYAENTVAMDITMGVLMEPLNIDWSYSFYDTVACATFTEITSASSVHPYVIHTRMVLDAGKITTMESIVTDAGDWSFNATSHLAWASQEKWTSIPENKQDTRAVIKAAGDAYLDNWANVSLPVPEGTPCARLEGGAYTGDGNLTANTCTMGAFPVPVNITNRRYVIDTELGSVGIMENFPWLDVNKPDGIPSSNMVRVESGMIRYIHEVTVCATPGVPGCGR
jgi:hypothetical protein